MAGQAQENRGGGRLGLSASVFYGNKGTAEAIINYSPLAGGKVRPLKDLLIVTNGVDRRRVEARLRSISQGGRLARWQEEA